MPNKPIPDGNRALPKKPIDTHDTDEDSMSNQEDFNQDQEIQHNSAQMAQGHGEAESMAGTSGLSFQVSKTLKKRLEQSAREEGVSVDDLASELLAEGLVLRAWEIVERKSTMRSGGSPQQQQHQQQRQGNVRQGHSNNKPSSGYQGGGNNSKYGGGSGGGSGGGGGGRMNKRHAAHATSLNVMEDKAAFLEYVRNQERKNR